MTVHQSRRRLTAIATLLAGSFLLSACFIQPGTFDATLHVQADRQFTFTYEGEIVMAGMSDLAEMAQEAEGDQPCFDEDGTKERPCTEDELADRARDDTMGRTMLESMAGGIDMSNPEAVAEMTSALERQAGWNSVEFMGDGVFMVDYSLTSTLGHDYDFPTFENLPVANAFVQVRLREDGRVRINAPGFSPAGSDPMSAMMLGIFGSFANMGEVGPEGETTTGPAQPQLDMRPIEGTFRIVTDARVLANNTDEGPMEDPRGQVLEWDISPASSPASSIAPSALIALES